MLALVRNQVEKPCHLLTL